MSVDFVMALVSLFMGYSLIPQILLSMKTKEVCLSWQTAWITSLGMWVFVSCYVRLGLWTAFSINSVLATLWTVLLIMKYYYEGKKR